MVRAKQRNDQPVEVPEHGARTSGYSASLRLANRSGEEVVESPARRMQLQIEQALVEAPGRRWSPRKTLAFIVLFNSIAWLAISWVIANLL